jgi:excisionase family DNA binding protein
MADDKLLTPEQVAERLQLSPFTVLDYLRTKRLRGVKLDRHWRVREVDLQAFIEAHLANGAEAVEGERPSAPPITDVIEPHTPENLELERRIRAMDKAGLTKRQIANQLNKEGVPAGTETGRWDVDTVLAWLETNAWFGEHRGSTADK